MVDPAVEIWPHVKDVLWDALLSVFIGAGAIAVVGTLLFFIGRGRTGRVSIRRLTCYLFPQELYIYPGNGTELKFMLFSYLFHNPIIKFLATVGGFALVSSTLVSALSGWSSLYGTMAVSRPFDVALQVAIICVMGELAFYVVHRWQHQNDWLWSFHRPHHSIEKMSLVASSRGGLFVENIAYQVADALFVGLPLGFWLYLTAGKVWPATTTIVAVYSFLFGPVLGTLHHSHLQIEFRSVARFINSPRMHQVHHSAELRHRNKNFGAAWNVFDRLFGTIYVPEPDETFRLGLSEQELGENNPYTSFVVVLTEPFVRTWTLLRHRTASANRQPG